MYTKSVIQRVLDVYKELVIQRVLDVYKESAIQRVLDVYKECHPASVRCIQRVSSSEC